ncbi:AAA family ATPase [Adlercreutzia sp. ZJ141]|uniref:AAA family ATPase n=1 Tax=Adlercreutzia sp. ZJ141 TaxID=2709406 RepID=UPI0013EDA8DA|nr:P-loop NTPase [Adlercreutzia sp. ZJ141]
MGKAVALCADEASMRSPEILGLGGEDLSSQQWLKLFSSGDELRRALAQDDEVDEVWVASCDDVEPINLAAAIKADRRSRRVHLVTCGELTGSFATRMGKAGLDDPLLPRDFARRYAERKRIARGEAYSDNSAHAIRGNVSCEGGGVLTAPASTPVVDVFPAQAMQATQATAGKAFVLPVVSGSGGAGKSTVAVLMALASQQAGRKTLLADFDLQFGDVARLVGASDALSIDDVMDDPSKIERLTPQDNMPAVLAAPRRLERCELAITAVPTLVDALSDRFDVIIVNTGAFWGEQHAVLLESASRVLFLVDQRPSSLWACQHALDLCARCGIATGPFAFALNRCAKGAPFTSVDVSCALGGPRVIELADGGEDVEGLLGAGLPLELFRDRSALCVSVEKTLAELMPAACSPTSASGSQRKRGLFGRKRSRRAEGGSR